LFIILFLFFKEQTPKSKKKKKKRELQEESVTEENVIGMYGLFNDITKYFSLHDNLWFQLI